MVDVVKYQARLRYRAKRLGYSVMLTRGLENRRREASGIGAFMLLGQDGVALHAATLDDIAKFYRIATGRRNSSYIKWWRRPPPAQLGEISWHDRPRLPSGGGGSPRTYDEEYARLASEWAETILATE
jgi:hypothetical protein